MVRPPYGESVAILKDRVDLMGDALPEVTRNPRHDDEVLGPSLFRMRVEDASFDELTLTGFYVGRTEVRRCSFRNTDLSLATFNWSDMSECDFTGADLSGADLRACQFVACDFSGARLLRADLRGSSFERCTFAGADLTDTVLYRRRRLLGLVKLGSDQDDLPLSKEQRRNVSWSEEAPEPGGG